jgi:hypothetical protein
MPNAFTVTLSAAVLCALAAGAISAMHLARADAAVKASPAASHDASAARCPGCGFVEAIRHVQAAGLVPAAYEFTVRMRDGSVRTSSDSGAAKWLVGDRIILVGGPQATAH